MDEDRIATRLDEIQSGLGRLGLPSVRLMDSSAWYREKFSTCGDWDAWIWETVNGRDYSTRKHHFDGFVVTQRTLGKANAQIVAFALRNDRMVFSAEHDGSIKVVKAVNCINANDWIDGWGYDAVEVGG
jgi:hypothetical protein